MKVLIVEDMEDKAKDLVEFIQAEKISDDIEVARSLQTGLRAALAGGAGLMLLDMTMTNFDRTLQDDGGRPHHFAGREILRQMLREDVHIPTIVVTNFSRFGEESEEITLAELKADLSRHFPDYLGTVHFRSNVDEWKLSLRQIIDAHFSGGAGL